MLVHGGSVFIARKFSVQTFWDEVVDRVCTIFQYIGELCRYLAASPPHRKERRHVLRLACGNGLQNGVWQRFQDRFQIPQILEFYAATEGAVSLYNWKARPGAIGFLPAMPPQWSPVGLIRVDPRSGEPLRGPDGFCIPCAVGEIGEALGRNKRVGGGSTGSFAGYTDADASESKVLSGVFVPGDQWVRTGDLMRRDAEGFWYFVDRIGDTFRWKGENVSTTEVAALLQACPGVTDAVVYGVAVPGHEGRAGMAALTTDGQFDLARFEAHTGAVLPPYARPQFVRLCRSIDLTGTFKLAKARLALEGYAGSTDPVCTLDSATGRYALPVPLDHGDAPNTPRQGTTDFRYVAAI